MCTILAVGQDAELLVTRAAVLRKCNAEVVAARPSEASKMLQAQRFNLLVLCHTVSSDDRDELIQLAHQQASEIQVLEILSTTEHSSDRSPSGADGTSSPNPATLVAKVIEMLNAQARVQ
jgi:CheY-like chemotaxis protein